MASGPRLALAVVLTSALLVALAAVGGVGYAAQRVAGVAERVVAPGGEQAIGLTFAPSAAVDQYGNPAGGGSQDVRGSSRNDTVTTGRGNDVVNGGAGNDRISTGAGNDRVRGGSGNDRISTGSGNDRIYGGPGRDTINSGSGNDTIYVRDGDRDRVTCGPGKDTVYADPARLDKVAADCEIVRRAVFKGV
jgi:Ca2+-binding RTX toxin-like protein